jgi:hypothetical protein
MQSLGIAWLSYSESSKKTIGQKRLQDAFFPLSAVQFIIIGKAGTAVS